MSAPRFDSKLAAQWIDNHPRAVRVLLKLLDGPLSREGVDRVGAASNGPGLIKMLRNQLKMKLPCVRQSTLDRDQRPTLKGIYELTATDRLTALSLFDAAYEALLGSPLDERLALDAHAGKCLSAATFRRAIRQWLLRSVPDARALLRSNLDALSVDTVCDVAPDEREWFFASLTSRPVNAAGSK